MSKDESDDRGPSTLTEVIVAELLKSSEGSLAEIQVTPFVEAIVHGLETVANKAIVDEDRLVLQHSRDLTQGCSPKMDHLR